VSYRIEELMVCRIASEIDDAGVTVLGSFTPLAYASYMLARLTHAPRAWLVGFNAIGMSPVELNLTAVEAAAYRGARAHWTFAQTTQTVHLGKRGLIECVSPAQIDGDGAFNLSVIGDYQRPKVRMPGGAGAPEVVQHYRRIVVYLGRHDRRTLVEKVDFRTGERKPLGDDARSAKGLLCGPVQLVTPLAVMRKDTDGRAFRLETLHPGVDVEDVIANTGFPVEVPAQIGITAVPTEQQVALLRTRIDPFGTIRIDFMDAQERKETVRAILQLEWNRALADCRDDATLREDPLDVGGVPERA
jgi:acyl CoA:acetate/3-ketoacid CoA transferase beta subunit